MWCKINYFWVHLSTLQKENVQLKSFNSELKSHLERNFPGPVAKILHFQCTAGSGTIPGQGTRSHMPQLRVQMLQLTDPLYSNEDSACDSYDPA